MSTTLDEPSRYRSLVSRQITRILHTDFCPRANRFVYWLKEPVGWFVVAAAVSVLVGLYVNPLGWILAAGLIGIIATGLVFPWFAVRSVVCELTPTVERLYEREHGELTLRVRNRLPVPLWGLAVEGYLTGIEDEHESATEIALAVVPPWCHASFRLTVQPEYRGHYPRTTPKISCAFPFGIWTARQPLAQVATVVVWPMRLALNSSPEPVGTQRSETADGNRAGSHGDVLGVRGFRQGDPLRSVHWAHTARYDRIIVCERTSPEQTSVTIQLDSVGGLGTTALNREMFAWRVRIASSLSLLLHGRHVPVKLRLDQQLLTIPCGPQGLEVIGDTFAALPLQPRIVESAQVNMESDCRSGPVITIQPAPNLRQAYVTFHVPNGKRRGNDLSERFEIDLEGDVSWRLEEILREVNHARFAA